MAGIKKTSKECVSMCINAIIMDVLNYKRDNEVGKSTSAILI